MIERQYHVYILTNARRTVLYTGVTGNLSERMSQHRVAGRRTFTGRYACNRLVYIEEHIDIHEAIRREKQIKAGSRRKKVALIESMNPTWSDLSSSL
jgi:putative endonuclease